jgi:hypothetical protein
MNVICLLAVGLTVTSLLRVQTDDGGTFLVS